MAHAAHVVPLLPYTVNIMTTNLPAPLLLLLLLCRVWQMVRRSLLNSLWSSPVGDVIELQLSRLSPMSARGNAERGQRLKLYARALNTSFEQVGSSRAT
jgi:hypothetical protein